VPWEARGSLRAILGTLSYQVASPTGLGPLQTEIDFWMAA
jgi:hypothetical protein